GNGERVRYVVRRLRPKPSQLAAALTSSFKYDLTTCDEYAFVDGKTWELATESDVVDGEEELPLFPAMYIEWDGRKRHLFNAMIPVAKREAYLAATAARILAEPNPPAPVDPRKAVLLRTITDPWRKMIDQYDSASGGSIFPTKS